MAKRSKIAAGVERGSTPKNIRNMAKSVVSRINDVDECQDDCQCIKCSGRLFGDSAVINRGKNGGSSKSDDLKKILSDSVSDSAIANGNSKMFLFKNINEVVVNNVLQKVLVYTNGIGIVVVMINVIFLSLMSSKIINIISSLLVLIVLSLINLGIKSDD